MAKNKRGGQGEDSIVWLRLPKGTSLKKLKELGLGEVACYGGDTCIAATAPEAGSGLMVQHSKKKQLQALLEDAGLNPRADCFGGDTCIV